MNYKQRWVILQKNKQRWLKVCPYLNDNSGIYILTRDDGQFRYAYIGQSKHILKRLAEHLRGYKHIDASLKSHGLYSEDNKSGWNVDFIECEETELNSKEQEFIKKYADLGYQLRNKTTGSQGKGKSNLDAIQSSGFKKGVAHGYNKAIKELNVFFDKYLDFEIKGKPNKIKERKFEEFKVFLGGTENEIKEDRGNSI